jgi:hypothetical protein
VPAPHSANIWCARDTLRINLVRKNLVHGDPAPRKSVWVRSERQLDRRRKQAANATYLAKKGRHMVPSSCPAQLQTDQNLTMIPARKVRGNPGRAPEGLQATL